MKIAVVNYSDISGGAARAAWRIHQSFEHANLDSSLHVSQALSGDWKVNKPSSLKYSIHRQLSHFTDRIVNKLLAENSSAPRSLSIIPSPWKSYLNQVDADIINLHWVSKEMISISDIGGLKKPIVWTLHDMWPICGSEHYSTTKDYTNGYSLRERRFSLDAINRWVWLRKSHNWSRKIHLVAPSNWMGDCIKQSALFANNPVSVIANPIDIDFWRPIDKDLARSLFGLPQNARLILFGAMGGGQDPRKGADLLYKCFSKLSGSVPNLELVVFGERTPKTPRFDCNFPIHYMGQLHDDLSLRILYSCADVFVIPSRQDNLPNTGVEALACGVPIVAFNVTGLPDLVQHHHTGYLAPPFDVDELANGIKWVLDTQEKLHILKSNCRNFALERFAPNNIAYKYLQVFSAASENHNNNIHL